MAVDAYTVMVLWHIITTAELRIHLTLTAATCKGSGMPTIEYNCKDCDHTFNGVVLRGEEGKKVPCPKCRSKAVIQSKPPTSLFNGISSFSTLSKDTN
jgi:putative FmdB family regulatory protein